MVSSAVTLRTIEPSVILRRIGRDSASAYRLSHSQHKAVANGGVDERSVCIFGSSCRTARFKVIEGIVNTNERQHVKHLVGEMLFGHESGRVERGKAVGFADLAAEHGECLRSVVDVVVERIADYVQRTVLPAVNIGCGEVDVVAACNGLNALRSRRAVACRAFPIIVVVEHVGIVARRHTENEALAILVVNHLAILSVSRERDFVCA